MVIFSWSAVLLTLICHLLSLFNKINRFHAAVRLISSRSQMTSKCGKNKEVARDPQASLSLMFLPRFDVFGIDH